MRHVLISQMEAEEIFQEKEEKVTMLGMKWVSRNRRMRTSFARSTGVSVTGDCAAIRDDP